MEVANFRVGSRSSDLSSNRVAAKTWQVERPGICPEGSREVGRITSRVIGRVESLNKSIGANRVARSISSRVAATAGVVHRRKNSRSGRFAIDRVARAPGRRKAIVRGRVAPGLHLRPGRAAKYVPFEPGSFSGQIVHVHRNTMIRSGRVPGSYPARRLGTQPWQPVSSTGKSPASR